MNKTLTTWTLTIPVQGSWLNANDRRNRHLKARLSQAWRKATWQFAKAAKLPQGLERVRIDAELRFATNRDRDVGNYYDTLKPIVDGLCRDKSYVTKAGRRSFQPGYGLIHDDTPAHLDGPHIRFAAVDPSRPYRGPGWVRLTITDLGTSDE